MKPLLKNARLCTLCLVNSPFKSNQITWEFTAAGTQLDVIGPFF